MVWKLERRRKQKREKKREGRNRKGKEKWGRRRRRQQQGKKEGERNKEWEKETALCIKVRFLFKAAEKMKRVTFSPAVWSRCSVNKPAPHLAPRKPWISVEPERLLGQTALNPPWAPTCWVSRNNQGTLTVSHFHSSERQIAEYAGEGWCPGTIKVSSD